MAEKDVVGKSFVKILPSAQEFGLLQAFQKVWKTGEPKHFPASFYQDDRISGWRQYYIYKLPSGEIVTTYSDVTRQQQYENGLKLAEQEKGLMLNNISEVVPHLDPQRRIKWMSQAAIEAVGAKPGDVVGRTCHEVWGKNDNACANCPFNRALKSGKVEQGELKDANGTNWEVIAYPVKNQEELSGVVEIRR